MGAKAAAAWRTSNRPSISLDFPGPGMMSE
jgi:hypothetical protein